jgi:methionyl aminopeptidase
MTILSEKEKEAMREGGKILAEIMKEIGLNIFPGQEAEELDKLAEELVFRNHGEPVFKGYPGPGGSHFPSTICLSINDEVVHGIPQPGKILAEGEIVKIDIGMRYRGLITDMARTFPVGTISNRSRKILDVTRKALDSGIREIRDGATLNDYARAVQSLAEEEGYSVIRKLVGHGVGKKLHEDPMIPNFVSPEGNFVIRSGMALALEPMINEGSYKVTVSEDGWTYRTTDGKLSAHFEDTVIVGKNGAEIITR